MNEYKSPKKAVDLDKYKDPTNLAPKNLELGLWLANHQKKIYKIIIIILASLASIFLVYSIYGYANYFIFGREQDKALQESNAGIDLANYRQLNTPLELKVGQAKAISSNIGTDFVVKLKNPNEKQTATFSFCFTKDEKKACASSFILPNEEKNIFILNSDVKVGTGLANFEINEIAWQKIKAGEIPNWEDFKNDRVNFSITDKNLTTYSGGVSYLDFKITNNSSYGYFEVPLIITASLNDEVMAIYTYIVQGLASRETKNVRFSWPEAKNTGGEILITPELNLLDNSIYRPYTSN